jgi:hypothetical protein
MAEYISVTGDELKLGRHVRLRVLAHLKHAAPHHCLAPEPGKVPSDFYTLAVSANSGRSINRHARLYRTGFGLVACTPRSRLAGTLNQTHFLQLVMSSVATRNVSSFRPSGRRIESSNLRCRPLSAISRRHRHASVRQRLDRFRNLLERHYRANSSIEQVLLPL